MEDVASEVHLAAVKAWPRYDPGKGTLTAWVDAITRNHASHHRESACVRRESPRGLAPWPPSGEPGTEASAPDEALDARRELAVVLAAFARLPALEREVLESVALGDDIPALAARSGRPASTLYKALYRGRATLERARRLAHVARRK